MPPRAPRPKAPAVPSTAVYVKNLSADLTTEEIEDLFLPFCDEGDGVLIVPYLDRGIAFVDLGSTEAVVRAVAAAKQERLRSRSPSNHGLVTVEPSKKPVRASGLRAMNVRLRGGGGGSEMDPRANGTGNGAAVGMVSPYAPYPTNSHGAAVAGLAAFPGRGRNDANYGIPNGGGLSGLTGRRGPPHLTTVATGGGAFSPNALTIPSPAGSLSLQGGMPCWVVLETRLCETCPVGGDGSNSGNGAITSQERRVVAVFLDQAQAVAAACALWEHIKASLAPPPVTSTATTTTVGGGLQPSSPSFTYQELREDKANGSFVRRVANGDIPGSYEVRQVAVEAPSYLNPTGQVLSECCGAHLVDAQDPNNNNNGNGHCGSNGNSGSNAGSPSAAAAATAAAVPSPSLPSSQPRKSNNALEASAGPWLPGVL